MPSAVSLEIFKHLFASVAEEMGLTLGRTGHSPNIKERLDYSCALFTGDGRLLAQAAHIPVHLGAMPASVRQAMERGAPLAPGDVVILNDPFLGGTHLPDVTMVSPVFVPAEDRGPTTDERFAGRRMMDQRRWTNDESWRMRVRRSSFVPRSGRSSVVRHRSSVVVRPSSPSQPPAFLVASRAHHADIGGMTPGSMPLSTEVYQEGLIIPPVKLVEAGRRNQAVWELILRNVRTPDERRGDLAAQLAAHEIGARRALEIVRRYGMQTVKAHADALLDYAEERVRAVVAALPDGEYTFEDFLESPDPPGRIPIRVAVRIDGTSLTADFTGTAPAVAGNLNAVRPIVESALAYVVRAIAGSSLPVNAGALRPLSVVVPPGCLLDAQPPHAVAAGNVETSQRVVDVLMGALAQALPDRIPAASQGTMNNLTFGGRHPETGAAFAYYETMGGGSGAGPHADGASGIHVHMSNTRNTPIEALEYSFPVRVERYSLRRGSGGAGRHVGGEGLQRDLRFLVPVKITVLSERRMLAPWGLHGGGPGAAGQNVLVRDGRETALPGKFTLEAQAGDVLSLRSPGGGGVG